MNRQKLIDYILLILKGIVVGFGAIMPGISGGTLCVAFGMYKPILNVLSHPFKTLKTDGIRLFFFILGGGLGFVGLSGLASMLMAADSFAVTLVFIGFILGTLPDLWNEAGGKKKRTVSSYFFAFCGFLFLSAILLTLRSGGGFVIEAGFGGFFLCGILWGLSFVVPGLSSSTLLIFFGLYQPMLEGISRLSIPVLFPLGIGVLLCILLLPRGVNALFDKYHSQCSHAIIGVVTASMVAVLPTELFASVSNGLFGILYITIGFLVSHFAGRYCNSLTSI